MKKLFKETTQSKSANARLARANIRTVRKMEGYAEKVAALKTTTKFMLFLMARELNFNLRYWQSCATKHEIAMDIASRLF